VAERIVFHFPLASPGCRARIIRVPYPTPGRVGITSESQCRGDSIVTACTLSNTSLKPGSIGKAGRMELWFGVLL
jgi:hypothetical protein